MDDLLVHEYAAAKLEIVFMTKVFLVIMGQSDAISQLSQRIYDSVKKY